jgi:hypothetical protein
MAEPLNLILSARSVRTLTLSQLILDLAPVIIPQPRSRERKALLPHFIVKNAKIPYEGGESSQT